MGWRLWFAQKFGGVAGQAMRNFNEANAAYDRNDYKGALSLYEACLPSFRQLEQWPVVLFVRLRLADLARFSGDYAVARTHLEQAISLARNQQNDDMLHIGRMRLALIAAYQGEIALAERVCAEALATQPLPEKALEYAATHSVLGMIQKTVPEALARYEIALEIYREKEKTPSIMACLCALGHCTERGHDNDRQRRWLQECLELCEVHEPESSDTRKTRSYALNNLGNIERFAGRYDEALELYRESLRMKHHLDDIWAIPYTLDGCAALAAERQEGARAARLLGKAAEMRSRRGTPLEPSKRPEYETILTHVRALLSVEEFEAAWEAGTNLSLDLAVAEALAD